jgi:hypothetical protein
MIIAFIYIIKFVMHGLNPIMIYKWPENSLNITKIPPWRWECNSPFFSVEVCSNN